MVREPGVYLPTMVVFETHQGIERLRLEGDHARAAAIEEWANGIIDGFGGRILPLDLSVSIAGGKLSALARKRGNHPGVADITIAATAQVHGLLLLTRNLKHFADLGIDASDPTAGLPR